ncbi:MAG: hypothetical protein WAW96_08585, partial [Alphaproteobacteria bacterium]
MTDRTTAQPAPSHAAAAPSYLISYAPFLHSLEPARTIYIVTQVAACGLLAAGLVFFGWRAAFVAALAIVSCAVVEKAYY